MSMVFVSPRVGTGKADGLFILVPQAGQAIAPKRIKRSRNGKLLRRTFPFAIRHPSKTCSTLAP
ncbi:MAG: hypothetical protein AAGI23_05395, partial [Bacteroidota bacterium]